MKKLFTLAAAAFVALSASARQPQVILNSPNEFDVKIAGQFYSGNSTVIPNLSQGLHTVEVYSVKGGFLGIGKRRELVSTTQFNLRNNDVRIDVDQNGQVRIHEIGSNADRRNRGDRVYDSTVKNHGTLQGKGKKYGHYKDKHKVKKEKKEKVYRDDDDDDRYDDDDDDKDVLSPAGKDKNKGKSKSRKGNGRG